MKTIALVMVLAAPSLASAAVSAGITLAQPVGFGAFASYWPTEPVSIDVTAAAHVFDVGVTGHVPLVAPVAGAAAPHRLLVSGAFGRVHSAFGGYAVGTHLGVMAGYGYQTDWDFRAMLGVAAFEGAPWSWSPGVAVALGKMF